MLFFAKVRGLSMIFYCPRIGCIYTDFVEGDSFVAISKLQGTWSEGKAQYNFEFFSLKNAVGIYASVLLILVEKVIFYRGSCELCEYKNHH